MGPTSETNTAGQGRAGGQTINYHLRGIYQRLSSRQADWFCFILRNHWTWPWFKARRIIRHSFHNFEIYYNKNILLSELRLLPEFVQRNLFDLHCRREAIWRIKPHLRTNTNPLRSSWIRLISEIFAVIKWRNRVIKWPSQVEIYAEVHSTWSQQRPLYLSFSEAITRNDVCLSSSIQISLSPPWRRWGKLFTFACLRYAHEKRPSGTGWLIWFAFNPAS